LKIPSINKFNSLKKKNVVNNGRISYKYILIPIVIYLSILFVYYSRVFFDYRPEWSWIIEVFEFHNNFLGGLFLIPLIYLAYFSRWKVLALGVFVSLVSAIPLFMHYGSHGSVLALNIFYLCLPLIVVGYINIELNWRKRERQASLDREKERQLYMAKVFEAHENERKLIAQELHDDVIQNLLLSVKKIKGLVENASHRDQNDIALQALSVSHDIENTVKDIKKLSVDLRPGILDTLGFLPALKWLIDRLNEENSMVARIFILGEERDLPAGSEVIVFRIVQESMNNIRRHACATEVVLKVMFSQDTISITITDNGRGFQVPDSIEKLILQEKLGLLGIQERVRFLNGILEIQSEPGKGTQVSVEFNV
jgi:two-component system, NarL family, sensor histidine kinase DegS